MKTTLDHLPLQKQQDITAAMETIVNMVAPEMVILFGSFSRGDWVEDVYVENGTTYEYKSDYDILVVTKKEEHEPPGLHKKIRRKIQRGLRMETPLTIIFHDIKYLNEELEQGHYFFSDIVKEGTMLYNTGKFELATPKELSSAARADKARDYFDKWFKNANDFFEYYRFGVERNSLNTAIFQLHQAAERYLLTIALVFTDYKPKTHDLVDLNKQAGIADPRFKTVFPNKTEEEKRLLILLNKAYIDSRYKLNYTVDPADLQWLSERVQKLQELTEVVCKEKIEGYGNG